MKESREQAKLGTVLQRPQLLAPLVAFGGAVAFYAVALGAGSHFDSDDTLYAQMAREMVQTGNWLDNQWSGVVLFEKPPLYLWSLAAAGATLGWGEAALRLPGTLFAAGALAALVLVIQGLGGSRRQALTAAGLLAGSSLFLLMTRRLMTDVPLVAMALGAAAAMAWRRPVWLGAFAGLAVLAKGPAAAPPLLVIALFGVLTRRIPLRWLGGATLVGLAVAGPWHLAETLRHGAAFWEGYVGYHVGARATSEVVPGLSVSQLLEVLASERLLLLAAVLGLGTALYRGLRHPLDRFALGWLVLTLAPALLSTTRLPHYLLPVVPALAILAVRVVPDGGWQARLAPLVAGVLVLASFADDPAALTFWLDPDFGPEHKRLGLAVGEAAGPDDLVASYDTTSAALTFYADHPVLIVGDDPRFVEVQQAVLMNQRTGLVRPLATTGFPRAPEGRRFVVARKGDVPTVVARLRETGARRLNVLALERLALVNEAGLGPEVE